MIRKGSRPLQKAERVAGSSIPGLRRRSRSTAAWSAEDVGRRERARRDSRKRIEERGERREERGRDVMRTKEGPGDRGGRSPVPRSPSHLDTFRVVARARRRARRGAGRRRRGRGSRRRHLGNADHALAHTTARNWRGVSRVPDDANRHAAEFKPTGLRISPVFAYAASCIIGLARNADHFSGASSKRRR